MNQTELDPNRPYHRHLEQVLAEIVGLLSRQAQEKEEARRGDAPEQDEVVAQIEQQHQTVLAQRLAALHPADIAFVMESLAPEARINAWTLVQEDRRGAVLLEASDTVRRSLVLAMAPLEISSVIRALDADDIADLLSSLPESVGNAVLASLDQVERDEVRSVLSFPEDSVGAMMDLDVITVREEATLEAVLRLLRRKKALPEHTQQLVVVDRRNILRGVLSLSDLLVNEPESLVGEIMDAQPTFFHTGDSTRDAIDAFEKYDLISSPVVNLHGQVVGRLTVDAVVDEIQARAQADSFNQVGLSEADEDLYSPVLPSARRRWPWLMLNLFTAFLATRVISVFEDEIATLVALATLMPIVASIGGNIGNQAIALVIRGLALNPLGGAQIRHILFREVAINAFNGLGWGMALGVVTWLFYMDVKLAMVIAAALALNMTLAAAVGVLAPFVLQRLGSDPTRGASIILTATTDSMGFFIFLGLAAMFLV
ncbi:magnesium transporter [Sinimarinibacterium sp. NLF-5-8]|uniref:magnesium transporter n=1 Tax=Sinimarinibacterium sp. NLF-5-8 TaxID=2698684 RepID=UPI00137C091F|nr:magnesium transporter [Sinimarinibacterium sp. NLF-5-8]QHS10425.1 magnesium transporter [Sinimarinibacterium sp. NLF-5-8]